MTYEKPEVRDFGSIADHTYTGHFNGASYCDRDLPKGPIEVFRGDS